MESSSTSSSRAIALPNQSTQVDLDGLFDVLAKHLYSTPAVAIRELIQNAHDAITRRRQEQPDFSAMGRIDVTTQADQRKVTITDNGAGLTDDELHRYLATVGCGYTRQMRSSGQDSRQALIGMFGLGFLSSFVIAERVEVHTTSCQSSEQGWRYLSLDGRRYAVSPADPRPIGSEVTLILRPEYADLAQPGVLRRLLGRYCALLPEPLWFGNECVNAEPPPWRLPDTGVVPHPAVLNRQRMAFAARMEQHFEPICTLPVAPQDGSDARGLLWVQDGSTYGSSDNRNISVYVRGMLLDGDARDLVPVWAGFIGGVIESDALTPTASREDLQRDEIHAAVSHHVRSTLINGLAALARQRGPVWTRMLTRHNEALLGAALCESALSDALGDALRIPTNHGDLLLDELVRDGRVHLSLGGTGGFEDVLFRALQIPVARGERYAVAGYLRQWAQARGLKMIEIGTQVGNGRLFHPESVAPELHDWLSRQLAWTETLVTARFSPAELPLMVVPDREAQLKERLDHDEANKRMASAALGLARAFTRRIDARIKARLYVNLDNPAIACLLVCRAEGHPVPEAATALLRSLKVLMAPSAEAIDGQPPLASLLGDVSQAVLALMTPGTPA